MDEEYKLTRLKSPDAVMVGNMIYYSTPYVIEQKKEAFEAGKNERDDEIKETIRSLEKWKNDAMSMWLPIIEYLQDHKEIGIGDSISEHALLFIKQRDDMVKAGLIPPKR